MDKDGRNDRRWRDDRDEKSSRRDYKQSKDTLKRPPKHDSRNRSRSPPRRDHRDDRRRDRSPPRGPARGAPPSRPNDRGPRPNDRDPSGPPQQRRQAVAARQPVALAPEKQMQDILSDEDSEAEMARIMGFQGFRTTKNTKVAGNDKNYGVNKSKKTEYRQYMNRVGGFNRPLSPGRG